jgi:hypothetical protein
VQAHRRGAADLHSCARKNRADAPYRAGSRTAGCGGAAARAAGAGNGRPEIADRITLLAQIAQQPSREASDTPRALRVTEFARDMVDDSIESLGAVGVAIQRLIEQADYAGALKLMTAETERQLNMHWRWRIGAQEFNDFYDENPAESALNALAYLATELVLSLSDPKDPIIQQIAQLVNTWLEHEIDPWGDGISLCVFALVLHGGIPPHFFRSEYDTRYHSQMKKLVESVGDNRSRRPDSEAEDLMDAVNVVRLRVYEQRGDIEAYLQLALGDRAISPLRDYAGAAGQL